MQELIDSWTILIKEPLRLVVLLLIAAFFGRIYWNVRRMDRELENNEDGDCKLDFKLL
ncbi:MAG: hypothetical protein OXU45_08815 [Candidatus Melainabacteria bacterium]|nr:hypothetical protein [Candidatus Melainabacteria bacterium]